MRVDTCNALLQVYGRDRYAALGRVVTATQAVSSNAASSSAARWNAGRALARSM